LNKFSAVELVEDDFKVPATANFLEYEGFPDADTEISKLTNWLIGTK
jgi:hypothetical protein